ncbi:MAG: outer membrane beta-barrel domain-containing protein [Polyangiaceae bacterium]|nr:outer membrane beta-barrel domain-containing protein [Polyangiaceae bacterium]
MKQARYWLLLAATMLLPQVALAQPLAQARRPAPTRPAPPAAPTPAPAPPPGSPASPAPPAQGSPAGEIELDEPKPEGEKPPADANQGSVPPANAAAGICEVDPSACPKQADISNMAQREVQADVYAVQQIYALRRHRFELLPYWSFSFNDQFVTHQGPGLGINYYLTNVLAIGINGTFYQPFNHDSDFNFENRRATRLAVPLNEYQAGGTVNFTYVPMYGKFSGFSKFIFHYDGFVTGGVGALRTRPIAVIDPDNRKFDYDWRLAMSVGLGLRVFLNRWFAVTAELRDYIYVERLENTEVVTGQETNQSTWYGNKQLTNDIQAQVGISVFLPFSWEYRLPK